MVKCFKYQFHNKTVPIFDLWMSPFGEMKTTWSFRNTYMYINGQKW